MTNANATTRKSILRAVREVITIVCGILLAFALDAWWDLKREEDRAEQMVRDLAGEFEEVTRTLDRYIGRNEQVITAVGNILEDIRGQEKPVVVSAGDLGTLLVAPTMNLRQRNLEALLASGDLDLLRSESLRTLLAVWPSAVEDVLEDELAARSFVHETLIPGLMDIGDLGGTFRWRTNDLLEWRREGYVPPPDVATEAEVVTEPGIRTVNLVQTREYFAAIANINYAELLSDARDILQELTAMGG